jgi:hypothetical protein
MNNIRHIIFLLLSFIGLSAKAQKSEAMMQLPPIQRAALIIKHFEGWHSGKGPYIGWGHRIQPGEHISHNITRQQGDSLLYEDLRKLFKQFKGYGDYALLLTVLSYNVGPAKILGNSVSCGYFSSSLFISTSRLSPKSCVSSRLEQTPHVLAFSRPTCSTPRDRLQEDERHRRQMRTYLRELYSR